MSQLKSKLLKGLLLVTLSMLPLSAMGANVEPTFNQDNVQVQKTDGFSVGVYSGRPYYNAYPYYYPYSYYYPYRPYYYRYYNAPYRPYWYYRGW